MAYVTNRSPITERAARALFLDTLNIVEPHPLAILANFVPSDNIVEFYGGLGEVAEMAEFGSAPHPVTPLPDRSKTVQNKRYKAQHEADKDAIRMDRTGMGDGHIRNMAAQARLYTGKLISDLLNAGTGTTIDSDYKGGAFFRSNHEAEGDQTATQTNLVSATGVTTAAVQADYRSARAALRAMKGSNNAPINEQRPMELVVVVPPALESNIKEALKSTIISQTTNIDVQDNTQIIVDGRSTSTTVWFVLNIAGFKPFNLQEADPVTLQVLMDGSEHTLKTGRILFSVEWMGRASYQWWQKAIRIG